MDDLGIAPPSAPGTERREEKKQGFFSRIFKKKRSEASSIDDLNLAGMDDKGYDIEEIRRKVGLDAQPTPEAPAATTENSPEPSTDQPSTEEPAIEAQANIPGAPVPEAPAPEKPSQEAPAEEQHDIPDWLKDEDGQLTVPEPAPATAPLDNLESATPWNTDQTEAPKQASSWADAAEPEQQPAGESHFAAPEAHTEQPADESLFTAPVEETPVEEKQPEAKTEFTADADLEHGNENSPWATETLDQEPGMSGIESDTPDEELAELDKLHEEITTPTTEAPAAEPAATDETQEEKRPAWTAEPEQPEPEYHIEADKAFADLEEKHQKLDAELEKVIEEKTAVPEWNYQKVEVTPDKFFKLKNGQQVKNFKELLDALEFIDDETFAHHVGENRNDFAAWIEHVLHEEQLAEQIRNKSAREELLKILQNHEKAAYAELDRQRKEIESKIKGKEKAVKKLRETEQKLEKLAKQLQQKSEEVAELRKTAGKRVKEKIDEHVATAMSAEQERIAGQEQGIAEIREELERERDNLKLAQEEISKLKKQHQEDVKLLNEDRNGLQSEREAIAKEREAAELVIAKAAEYKKMKADAEAARADAKKALNENKRLKSTAQRMMAQAKKAKERLTKEQKEFRDQRAEIIKMKRGFTSRENALKRNKAKLEKEKKSLKAEMEKLKAERESTKEFVKQETGALDKQRKEVEELLQQVEQKIDAEEKARKENESALHKLHKRRKALERREKELESSGLKQYISSKMDETVAGEGTSEVVPPVEEVTNVHLYRLIDQCKDALDRQDLTGARKMYNSLREEFGKTKLSTHEKSVLYNAIRELYDDIHLAMLNQ